MSGALQGRTVVVLGGSGPYGGAVARELGREGASVALGGRDRQRLEELEAEIRAHGGEALALGVHLAKRHHPAHLVEAAVEHFGGLDVLLFAAHAAAPPLATLDLDAWERSVDVNVKGFLYCLAAALPAMLDGGGGRVVVLEVLDPSSEDPLLEAARVAVRVLLQNLAAELGDRGIRADEIRVDRSVVDPERCAETVRNLLSEASPTSYSLHEVSPA
jgi:NADP-dependent 3-hydroxy acid dehydrogenase YdfG